MDIKVKDLGDAVNQLTAIENTIADIMNLLKLQKTTVTASLESKLKILSEVFYFQKPDQVEILDHVDIDLSKVSLKIQESLKNLINKYALIEMLTDLENQVKGIETSIKVNFLNDPNLSEVLAKLEGVKTKIKVQKQNVIDFLNQLAQGSLPSSFTKFVFSVAENISNLVAIKPNSYQVQYTLSTYQGSLLYGAYIHLKNLKKDVEGLNRIEVVPDLYLTLLWLLDSTNGNSKVRLALTYEWQPPSDLFNVSNVEITSTTQANQLLDSLLRGENISLKTKDLIEDQNIDLQKKIISLSVDPDCIQVKVRNLKDKKLQTKLYMSIPKLFGQGTQYTASVDGNTMSFYVKGIPTIKYYTDDELREFLSWGLTLNQIDRIETILLG